ncbi:hypothetical protein C4D60_Mb11t02400 [Musa balbisiana]|uniref:Uncharacterized protein n=1 Tax=Musa balbisiana TaxID=52838 RepID=A0A4S8J177_MUSBA|nr:hypothetical protein C4D60_Mb11t02400 [Musa balbisiana]
MVPKSSSRVHADAMCLGQEGGDSTRIVVLAGENRGAVTKVNSQEMVDTGGVLRADEKALAACANSNYQAVNNSIELMTFGWSLSPSSAVFPSFTNSITKTASNG